MRSSTNLEDAEALHFDENDDNEVTIQCPKCATTMFIDTEYGTPFFCKNLSCNIELFLRPWNNW